MSQIALTQMEMVDVITPRGLSMCPKHEMREAGIPFYARFVGGNARYSNNRSVAQQMYKLATVVY